MKKYLKTIVYSALTLFALFFIWLKSLDIYTANNRHIQVPDFSGIHISDLDSAFKKTSLDTSLLTQFLIKIQIKESL